MGPGWQGMALEILDTIFSFTDEKDAARSAQVCKNWMEVALDHAWFEIDSGGFICLCEVLAPLRVTTVVLDAGQVQMVRSFDAFMASGTLTSQRLFRHTTFHVPLHTAIGFASCTTQNE